MSFKKQDYSYLLDNLRDLSRVYSLDLTGEVINKDGQVENNERVKNSLKFDILYCMAYRKMDTYREKNPSNTFDRQTVDRALASYGMFTYFINTCVGEYGIYDDIGTGEVTYIPYQPLADFFFEDETRKEILMNYLRDELKNVFENESDKKRVKR